MRLKMKYQILLTQLLKLLFNVKINEVKDEIPNITNLATASVHTAVENKMSSVSNLFRKLTITYKLRSNWS